MDDLPDSVVLALAAYDASFEFLIGLSLEFSLFPSVASAGSEVVCGSMSSPDFLFKKPTLMLLNASSRQWAVQVGYKLTK